MSDFLEVKVNSHLSRLENVALEMQHKSTHAFAEARQTDIDMNATAKVASYAEAQAWSIAAHMLTDPIKVMALAVAHSKVIKHEEESRKQQAREDDPFPDVDLVSQGWTNSEGQVVLELTEEYPICLLVDDSAGGTGVAILDDDYSRTLITNIGRLKHSVDFLKQVREAAFSKSAVGTDSNQDLLAHIERLAVDAKKWRDHMANPFGVVDAGGGEE